LQLSILQELFQQNFALVMLFLAEKVATLRKKFSARLNLNIGGRRNLATLTV
jgi:hypothetical protein